MRAIRSPLRAVETVCRQSADVLPSVARLTHQGRILAGARRSFYDDAAASGPNALYMESIYAQWKLDPSRVDRKWDAYFKALEAGTSSSPPMSADAAGSQALSARLLSSETALQAEGVGGVGGVAPNQTTTRVSTSASQGLDPIALKYLIRAHQVRGHEEANLDPLGKHLWRTEPPIPELMPAFHGFTEADMARRVESGNMLWRGSTGGTSGFLSSISYMGGEDMSLADFVQALKSTYCGTMGIEYMHISDRKRCNWIRQRVESPDFLAYGRDELVKIYERLCLADSFERFLGSTFKTTKRFGIDGGEAVIPGLQALVDKAADLGCEEFVVGMPHRGRLNVLVNVLGKPMPQMMAEFAGKAHDPQKQLEQLEVEDWSSAGDVKYHLGTSNVKTLPDGRALTLTLEANPSHLETVNPVTIGRVRAKQYYLGNDEDSQMRVMPILMHGDAAFAGQGIVYETMQLAQVDDFRVGGTIHVIVNNQVGFTTDPKNSRSTLYCSDLGKAFNVPVFHCNGDDPVAVVRAFEMAAEWRQEWATDVILDIICYRRFGHNENDNPSFTQPLLYQAIANQPRTEELFADRLTKDGTMSPEEVQTIRQNTWSGLEKDLEAGQNFKGETTSWLPTKWDGIRTPLNIGGAHPTGVDIDLLKSIGRRLCIVPEDFKLHRGLTRIMKTKLERVEEGSGLDWGTAEGLAFGSLLLEGNHVRITGQDVQRGTFSHRHCVVKDQNNNSEYNFLNNLDLGPQENFVARNSILSEYAVLGYELGYSYENPNALVIWEAQFGDFANTAQVMFDQFIAAGEHKWMQQSALTMLLPHGYDGQGAEHSSCRLERFLQLCDDDEDEAHDTSDLGGDRQIQRGNWQVMNLSTPANYYHALRQQLHRDFRKPLVVAAPKNLLRLKACTSSLEDMGPDSKFLRLIPERDAEIAGNPSKVERLVFCTGKVYYELVAEREKLGLTNVAIVTVEMIAPFPYNEVRDQIKLYDNVDRGDGIHPGNIIWCQEEPKNMGAWSYIRPRLVCIAREALNIDLVMRFVGRRASAAPAGGGHLHAAEQQAILKAALVQQDATSSRPSVLLGHQT